MYQPPTDDRMEYPGSMMICIPVRDSSDRRYFLRMLEVDFRGFECAANRLRRPENRVQHEQVPGGRFA